MCSTTVTIINTSAQVRPQSRSPGIGLPWLTRLSAPFQTTNYDPLLEHALEELGVDAKEIASVLPATRQGVAQYEVIHLHGVVDPRAMSEAPGLVLAEDEYFIVSSFRQNATEAGWRRSRGPHRDWSLACCWDRTSRLIGDLVWASWRGVCVTVSSSLVLWGVAA
jgi:hypothetical protein